MNANNTNRTKTFKNCFFRRSKYVYKVVLILKRMSDRSKLRLFPHFYSRIFFKRKVNSNIFAGLADIFIGTKIYMMVFN